MVVAERLTEHDLDFIVRTSATHRQDYEHIKDIVRDKPDILDVMLDEERLFKRLLEREGWASVSPYLFFTVLLRQAMRDLARESYTLERTGRSQRVPVFDSQDALALLKHGEVRDYLAQMLASFTRVNTTVAYYRWRGRLHRRRFSDIDIDDMLELSLSVDPESRFAFYKRIADIALFMVGIFPDYVARHSPVGPVRFRLAGRRVRTLEEYHQEGRRFYELAAEQAGQANGERDVLRKMAERFHLAVKPLNVVSERYISLSRMQLFSPWV